MSDFRKIFLSGFLLFLFSVLNAQTDSTITIDSSMDCTTGFFARASKIDDGSKIMLVTKGAKTMSLADFLKSLNMGETPESVLIDLDNDGGKELVINDFTGGAHCCDEFFFYKNTAPGKYQYVGKTFAGDVCVTETNDFLFNFYQQFGYFFTCFACAYEDSSGTGPEPISNIVFTYKGGKLVVTSGDQELRTKIINNLGILSRHPYQKLKNEIDQDDGLRKEFAMNLAVFHYSFGQNLPETKKLFDQYYKFPDAKKVWTEFVRQLQEIKKNNDF